MPPQKLSNCLFVYKPQFGRDLQECFLCKVYGELRKQTMIIWRKCGRWLFTLVFTIELFYAKTEKK